MGQMGFTIAFGSKGFEKIERLSLCEERQALQDSLVTCIQSGQCDIQRTNKRTWEIKIGTETTPSKVRLPKFEVGDQYLFTSVTRNQRNLD